MRRVAGNGRLQREVGGLLVQAEEREDGVLVATRSGRDAGRNQMRERKVTAGRLLQKRADRTAMVQSVPRSVVASAAFALRVPSPVTSAGRRAFVPASTRQRRSSTHHPRL
jgi:hypothetical protein